MTAVAKRVDGPATFRLAGRHRVVLTATLAIVSGVTCAGALFSLIDAPSMVGRGLLAALALISGLELIHLVIMRKPLSNESTNGRQNPSF